MGNPRYGPSPDLRVRFLDEVGDAYLFGLTCGSAFHFFKGLRNSPIGGRLAGAALAVRGNAPRVAGSLAAFWGVWSVFDSALLRARREEDRWNTIAAAAAASAVLDARRGARTAALSSLVGAAFFALIEGASVVLDNTVLVSPPARPSAGPGGAAPVGHPPDRPGGVLGVPTGPPMVVQELPAADLEYYSRQLSRRGWHRASEE